MKGIYDAGAFADVKLRCARFHDEKKRKPIARVITFGCKMNENDSEKISGLLVGMGFDIERPSVSGRFGSPASLGSIGVFGNKNAHVDDVENVSTSAGGDVSEDAGGDVSEDAGGDVSEDAGEGMSEYAGGDVSEGAKEGMSEYAGGDMCEDAGGDMSEDAGEDVSAVAGEDVTSVARDGISVNVGGNAVNVNDAAEMNRSVIPELVILNTCCVRENAEQRLFGILGSLGRYKRDDPARIVAVCGCMAQEESAVSAIQKKHRIVDFIFGTKAIMELPSLISDVYTRRDSEAKRGGQLRAVNRTIPVSNDLTTVAPNDLTTVAHDGLSTSDTGDFTTLSSGITTTAPSDLTTVAPNDFTVAATSDLTAEASSGGLKAAALGGLIKSAPESQPRSAYAPMFRKAPPIALVSVMSGCDNFCSYCIVPYVRGREQSRSPDEITDEIKRLILDGYSEVLLLGQNVNSYGKGLQGENCDFSSLLERVAGLDGIKRVRFMTSHPKDISERLIYAIRDVDGVCPHVHLPVQSGSTAILSRMNRGYSRDDYLNLVFKIRDAAPSVTLTTDIIVGFPGESDDDFQDTLDLVRECDFDLAYTFKYSPREGTAAAVFSNRVREAVIKERFEKLLELQNEISLRKNIEMLGKIVEVLCEGVSKTNPNCLTGKTLGGKTVNFTKTGYNAVTPDLIGSLVNVRIENARTWSLDGVAP